jgi:hypothetical protein
MSAVGLGRGKMPPTSIRAHILRFLSLYNRQGPNRPPAPKTPAPNLSKCYANVTAARYYCDITEK